MRIALRHRGAALSYTRAIVRVRDTLGDDAGRVYTELVVMGVEADGELGAGLARQLPDLLGRLEAPDGFGRLMARALRERPGAAAAVARILPELLGEMDEGAAGAFVDRALALWNASPAQAESFLRRESDAGQREARELVRGTSLAEVRRLLVLYARAHCGEDVDIATIAPGARGHAERRRLHLPERVRDYGDERDFLVYRVMTAHCAGYLEFGTFDLGDADQDGIERLLAAYGNRSLARDLFQVLEDRRVELRVREAYPGVARDIDRLRGDPARPRPEVAELSRSDQVVEALARHTWGMPLPPGLDPEVRRAVTALLSPLEDATLPPASVRDVATALPAFYDAAARFLARSEPAGRPPPNPGGKGGRGEGSPRPDDTGPRQPERAYQGLDLPTGAGRLLPEPPPSAAAAAEAEVVPGAARKASPRDADPRRASYEEMVAWLDRKPTTGGALVDASATREAAPQPGATAEAAPAEHDYPEWDATIADYKPRWVRVVEHAVEADDTNPFVANVRTEHGALIKRLRRSFEALRPDARQRTRRLVDGDELDIDAAIEARVVARAGGSPSDRVYARRAPIVRDVCSAFLVDLSSSTNEVVDVGGKRIIDVEKEALVCISEALDALGDRFGIFGFSGYGRDHVAFYVAKEFDEPLDDAVRARVGGLRWKMENRDGAAIRHATRRLLEQPARRRLLFLLSDGRPLDCGCDRYFDRYAQEDTRVALREARRAQVHPFCLTVDPRGSDYLETMYGRGAYTVVERVDALPSRLPALYRRLTR